MGRQVGQLSLRKDTAGVIGGVIGGITAGAGATFLKPVADEAVSEVIAKGVGRAILAGALTSGASAIEHSSIRDGFIGAAVSALLSPGMNGAFGGGPAGLVLRVAASAVAGGTVAELTGGRFANGALTAGFVRLFQEEMVYGSQAGTKNAGSATSPVDNALRVAMDVVGKIWNIPNDIIGLAIGVAGLPFGGEDWNFAHGALEITGNKLMQWGAITFGNVSNYGPRFTPFSTGYDDNIGWIHEFQHGTQGQIFGPLYIPLNVIGGSLGLLLNGDWHGPANFMEAGPSQHPPVPFPGWGW